MKTDGGIKMRVDIFVNVIAMYALIFFCSFLFVAIPTYLLSFFISFLKKKTLGIPNSIICGLVTSFFVIAFTEVSVIYH